MLARVNGCDYYTYNVGFVNFIYYPDSGMVKCSNATSTYRCVEHFARRGFEIDWVTSNVVRNTLHVKLPEHLTEEEVISTLSKTKEELYAEHLHKKEEQLAELLSCNIDENTGKVITDNYLTHAISSLNTSKSKSRGDAVAWFNHYNIEAARPDSPVIILSTKSKRVIIEEGKKIIWSLFNKGELRKLTKEDYQKKMDNYHNTKEVKSGKEKEDE